MGSPRKTVFSVLAVFAAVWLAAKFLLPLLSPFLLGALLALAAEPMVRFLSQKVHTPRAVSTAIGVSMAFCFLAMLLLILCAFALRQLKNLAGVLPDLESTARSGLALAQTRLLELAAPLELPPPSEREQQFQALWTQFYKTLEIQARHNEKGRMSHCPKRFWADMVEMKDEF